LISGFGKVHLPRLDLTGPEGAGGYSKDRFECCRAQLSKPQSGGKRSAIAGTDQVEQLQPQRRR